MPSTDANNLSLHPWVSHNGIRNLRDIGGYATAHNTSVRKNYIFRSAAPNQLTPEGIEAFKATGIRTVYDLRSAQEILDHPNMPPLNYIGGVEYKHVPVFDESWSPEYARPPRGARIRG